MHSIGDLAQKTGVKVPTIRYYEQMGLIELPERTIGNQRRYDKSGLQRLSFIRHSRDLGFSIENIRELIELGKHPNEPCTDVHEIALRNLADTRRKITRLKRLEQELKRLSTCDAKLVENCAVFESLADHRFCQSDH
ncbi:MAG: MerR family transcriptional regulator [Rhizobiaceae bacterium]